MVESVMVRCAWLFEAVHRPMGPAECRAAVGMIGALGMVEKARISAPCSTVSLFWWIASAWREDILRRVMRRTMRSTGLEML